MKEPSERTKARNARTAVLRAIQPESRAVVKARADRCAYVARVIVTGLGGKPFHWRGCDNHYLGVAEEMGFTLVTLSRAESAGWELKKQQKPVGFVYFTAPISRTCDVYVLECQFNRKAEKK